MKSWVLEAEIERLRKIAGDALGSDGPDTSLLKRETQLRYEVALMQIAGR